MNALAILSAAGAGGILLAVVQAVLARHKNEADAADVITSAATRAVAMVSADNQRLRDEVRELSAQVRALTAEVHALRAQVSTLDHDNLDLLRRLAEWDPGAAGRLDRRSTAHDERFGRLEASNDRLVEGQAALTEMNARIERRQVGEEEVSRDPPAS